MKNGLRAFILGLLLTGLAQAKVNVDAVLAEADRLGWAKDQAGKDKSKNPFVVNPKLHWVENNGKMAKDMTILDDFLDLSKNIYSKGPLQQASVEDANLLALESEFILNLYGLEVNAYKPGNACGYDTQEKQEKLSKILLTFMTASAITIENNKIDSDRIMQWIDDLLAPKKADQYNDQKKPSIRKHLSSLSTLTSLVLKNNNKTEEIKFISAARIFAQKDPWFLKPHVTDKLADNNALREIHDQIANLTPKQKVLLDLSEEDFNKLWDVDQSILYELSNVLKKDTFSEADLRTFLTFCFDLNHDDLKTFLETKGLADGDKTKVLNALVAIKKQGKNIVGFPRIQDVLSDSEQKNLAAWIDIINTLTDLSTDKVKKADKEAGGKKFKDIEIAFWKLIEIIEAKLGLQSSPYDGDKEKEEKKQKEDAFKALDINKRKEFIKKNLEEWQEKELNLYNELLKAKEATAKRWDDLLGDWKDEEERKAVREKILKGKEYENVDKFDLYATLKAMKDGGSNLLGFDQLIERLNVIDDYDDAKKNAQRIIAMLKFLNNLKKDGVCFGEFAVDPISKSWPRQDSAYDQKKFEEIINIDLKYLYKHFFKEQ